jgi:hypothetical protein
MNAYLLKSIKAVIGPSAVKVRFRLAAVISFLQTDDRYYFYWSLGFLLPE